MHSAQYVLVTITIMYCDYYWPRYGEGYLMGWWQHFPVPELMQLSNFRVISSFDQIFAKLLLCFWTCQLFLESWKINPTRFLPSDGSQLLAKEP